MFDAEGLANDPLYRRLRVIRDAVENGRADAVTVERWEELRRSVARVVASLKATMASVPLAERDKVARAWVQAFTDEHWPEPTRH